MPGAIIRLTLGEYRDFIRGQRGLLVHQNQVVGIADDIEPIEFRRGSGDEEIWKQYEAVDED